MRGETLLQDDSCFRLKPEHEALSTARTIRLVLQAALREGLLDGCRADWAGDHLTLRRNGVTLSVRGRTAAGGDRFFLEGPAETTLGTFLSTLRGLLGGGDETAWRQFEEELLEAHFTQSLCYALCWERAEPREYLDYEAWTPEGHNLHPGAKTRSGFTPSDNLRYAPELATHVDLSWIGVDKSLLSPSGVVAPLFEEDLKTWAIPVHPWQRSNVLPSLYAAEWHSGAIRDLEREPLRCRLCTSLRTVVPVDADLPVLKTSVGALMTSTERSMSCHTVRQGPLYSDYLRRAAALAPALFERVVALEESGGFSWRGGGDSPRSRNLSLLFRQRPPSVGDGVAVPCSTLPQPTWDRTTTYFGRFFGQREQARERFSAYLELVVPFHLKLYSRFGLALEAHLQNCVVVWGEEGPRQLWVRDWGGLRADGRKLRELAPDLFEQLDPGSVTLTDAVQAERKLVACLYCNHLTELVAGVARAGDVEEAELWREVARVSAGALDESSGTTLRRRILEEPWPVKCLLRMRLGNGSGDVYRERPNPLRRFL